jgi:phosphoglycerate kinase
MGMSRKRTVGDLDVQGKRVFCRVDYNVPVDQGKVGDDTRIRGSLETLRHLMGRGARTVLASHLGRPAGKPKPELSLAPVAEHLGGILGKPVAFVASCIGEEAERAAQALAPGDVLLLENLRFHKEEEANDATFAASLAKLGEIYVNDAFGTAHRAHASTVGVPQVLKPAVAGFLMEKELTQLGRLLEKPESPFVAIRAAPRSPTRSSWSRISCRRWISSSSAVRWRTPSSRPS